MKRIRHCAALFEIAFAACAVLLAFDREAAAGEEPLQIATDPPAPPAPVASADQEATSPFEWLAPWQLEAALLGSGGFGPKGYIYGGGLGVRLRHRRDFDSRPFVSLDDVAGVFIGVLTLGITAAPQGMWLGNERGFELRAQYLVSGDKGTSPERRVALSLLPSFRITKDEKSRMRFPAVISCFLPELGFAFVEERKGDFLLGFHPFTMGFLLSDHIALEIDPSWLFPIPIEKRPVQVWAVTTLSFAVR